MAGSTLRWVDFDGLELDTLQEAAKRAGVFLYTDKPCNVWANGACALFHAASDGDVRIRMRGAPIYDAIGGEQISESSEAVINMRLGDTRILRMGDR